MKYLIVSVCFFVAVAELASGTGSGAKELWQKQMQTLDELIANNKIEARDSPNTRKIGLPFFDIAFEDEIPVDKTVHTLRPQDIDIVGAMGDSITAANGAGADTVAGLAIEWVGICYSIGGDDSLEQSITLPNILKKFNPRLDGYSVGNGPLVRKYPYGFNVAIPGARADDMLGQAEVLIDLLKTDNRSNYHDDWKMITLFIGGNDLCAIGRDPEGTTPEVYVAEIKKALDLLHSEVPRMFVNLVDILDIYLLPYVGYGYGSTPQCRALQSSFCGYVVDTMNDTVQKDYLRGINRQYQMQLQALIDSGIYDTRDDFTVIVQPFLRDAVLPYTEYGEVDATYFAPDCFHFSDIGHAMSAINLWNNMLEPVGQKTTVWSITDLKVPTKEHPYIFTYKNSGPTIPTTTKAPEVNATSVPVWVIVLAAILLVVLAGEAFMLVYLLRKKSSKGEKSQTMSEKGGHVNEGAYVEKM
uniref:phospholipase B1, membrane-associated-like n=1 Tax=Styela clava TaxID=7725 RepID=UPI001939DA17|nr:phospholipase B1, membrane-associated-like [Styela clava]